MKDCWELLPKKILLTMLNNQVILDLGAAGTDTTFGILREEMAIWCDANCNGFYRLINRRAYFEEESDMVAFKLNWDGKEIS